MPVGSTPIGREFVSLAAAGGKRWRHVVQAQTYALGDLHPIAASAWNAADYAVGVAGGRSLVTLDVSNLPPTSSLTPPVATYTGSTAPGTYGLISNNSGWETKPLPGGAGIGFDTRGPYRALPMRQWVGF